MMSESILKYRYMKNVIIQIITRKAELCQICYTVESYICNKIILEERILGLALASLLPYSSCVIGMVYVVKEIGIAESFETNRLKQKY